MGKSENDYTVLIIRQVRPFCSEVVGTLNLYYLSICTLKYITFEDGLNSGIFVDKIMLETTSGDKS